MTKQPTSPNEYRASTLAETTEPEVAELHATPRTQSATRPVSEETGQTVYQVPRRVIRIALPDGWLRGILSGVQASLMGWALATVLALLSYFSVFDNPWMTGTTWSDAMSAGASLWAASLGSAIVIPHDAEDSTIIFHAIPLTMTLMTLLALRVFLRSCRGFGHGTYLCAPLGFVAANAFFIGANHGWHYWSHIIIGSLIMAILACEWAWNKDHPEQIAQILERLAGEHLQNIRRGLQAAQRIATILVVCVTLLIILAMSARRAQVVAIVDTLVPASTWDSVMITAVQSLFLPNVLAWVLAWLTGAGVTLGGDAVHSISSTVSTPIAPIPLLGLLPTDAPGSGWVIVPVLVAAAAGGVWGWKSARSTLGEEIVMLSTMALTLGGGVALYAWMSQISLGAGRMAVLGPQVWWLLLLITLEISLPITAGYLATHPLLVASLRAPSENTPETDVNSRAEDDPLAAQGESDNTEPVAPDEESLLREEPVDTDTTDDGSTLIVSEESDEQSDGDPRNDQDKQPHDETPRRTEHQ